MTPAAARAWSGVRGGRRPRALRFGVPLSDADTAGMAVEVLSEILNFCSRLVAAYAQVMRSIRSRKTEVAVTP
jgi:hypothetical protein